MKTFSKSFIYVCCFLMCSSYVNAAPLGQISFSNGPAAGMNKITGSGTYQIQNANWTVSGIRLVAAQSSGGTKYFTNATVGQMGVGGIGTWNNGNNGDVSINNLPAGSYTLYAEMDLKNGLNFQTIFSATFILNVN